ncbi:Copia protein, partial [Trichinella britovi]
MDVVTAFLNLNLNEEIYMELPTGVDDENNKYCRLRKSIYGLKQASRAWYGMLDDTLQSFGLNRLKNEP